MNKQETYDYLNSRGIVYEAFEHPAVFTVEEADALQLPYPETNTKNLFLRDDKKRSYYLLTVREDCPVSLKAFQQQIGSRKLSFASEDDLQDLLGLIRGSVTPLGLLNDAERKVQFCLDSYFAGRRIAMHPNENTATIFMNADDLLTLLREHGSPVTLVDFPDQN